MFSFFFLLFRRNKTLGSCLSYLFNTREWYISIYLFLIVLSQWSKMAKKSPVFFEVIQGAGCFTSIYYFLVVSWRKGCSLSVLDVDAGWCSGPQFCLKHYVKNIITTSTVLRNSGLSTWTDCSRIRVCFLWRGKDLKMTASKKQQSHVQIFLQEADWANFCTEFLIGSTNVHRSDINDWQTRCFRCLIVNDCLAPCASVWLWNT